MQHIIHRYILRLHGLKAERRPPPTRAHARAGAREHARAGAANARIKKAAQTGGEESGAADSQHGRTGWRTRAHADAHARAGGRGYARGAGASMTSAAAGT